MFAPRLPLSAPLTGCASRFFAVDTITTHVWIPAHPRLSPRIPKNPYIFTSSKFLKINYLSAKTDIQVFSLGYRFFMPLARKYLGGGERDRTDDLMLAKHALSQLSYTPADPSTVGLPRLVGLDGFEPSTPALSRRCSNQLSYRPGLIEPGSRPEAPGRQNSSP